MSALTTASSLVTVGTITTGTWNAGSVTSSAGVTAKTEVTVGSSSSTVSHVSQIIYGSSTLPVASANGSTGNFAINGFSALAVFSDSTSGKTCIAILYGGGHIAIVSDPATAFSTAGAGAGDGLIHLTLSSGNVVVTNETGSALTMQCTLLRMN